MRFLSLIFASVVSLVLADFHLKDEFQDEKIDLQAIVEQVNSDPTNLWKADTYGYPEISVQDIRKQLGTNLRKNDESTRNRFSTSNNKFAAERRRKVGSSMVLPKSYDARARYPNCNSISHIRDQSFCGSCWAVSATSVLSDRLCIQSKGRYNYELSSRFMLSCDWGNNFGCYGGWLDIAWDFLERNGTVTGGEFYSDQGCQPYPMHPCGWPKKLGCPEYITPKCLKNKCDNEFHHVPQEKYTIKATDAHQIVDPFGSISEYDIRYEIFHDGPVQAAFMVYEDFISYKSGIYKRQPYTRRLGGHAVKIIGWGEEKGVKYWLLANSWSESWGENGTFRMIRGINNCGIEEDVWAGNLELQ